MDARAIERAAALLIEARRTRAPTDLPEACRPHSLDEAYAIQEAVTAGLGEAPVGWKIGATDAAVRALEGFAEPVAGRLFAGHVHAAPADLPAALFTTFRNCETEFAFRLARDLPPRQTPYRREEVVAAIATLHPAIEIGDTRYRDRAAMGGIGVCADNSGGTEFVRADGIAGWRDLDLPSRTVTLEVDGAVRAEGAGSAVMGDPVEALLWLANHLSRRGIGLEAGEIVTTGSCTGITKVDTGARARADFGDLGEVVIDFGRARGEEERG
jgi:2-keto-4-pentenoate hydratase